MGGLVLSAASALTALLGLAIERVAGYPAPLQKTVGHPVQWQGALVAALETWLNTPGAGRPAGRARGVAALALLIAATLALTLPLALILRSLPGGLLVEALIAAGLLSQKSLAQHVEAVAAGLESNVDDGRAAVRHIVGRDPQTLDESGVCRAALESLAENTSDGVTAPLLWLIIGGLPGIAVYKAINTADSMIGHRNARFEHFGWASARADDLVNLPASRLTGFLIAIAAAWTRRDAGRSVLAVMRRDAPRHVSPNAGWPEAALAGALGIRLGGPRSYGGHVVDLAWMGDGRTTLAPADIRAGLALYGRLLNLLFVLAAAWLGLAWTAGRFALA